MPVGVWKHDPAYGGQRRSDVGGRGGLQIFSRLDAAAQKDHGHALIVRVRRTVGRAGGGEYPTGFRRDDQVSAAAGNVAERRGAKERIAGFIAFAHLFTAEDSGDSGNRGDGIDYAL